VDFQPPAAAVTTNASAVRFEVQVAVGFEVQVAAKYARDTHAVEGVHVE